MTKRTKPRRLAAILALLVSLVMWVTPARADIGPKPSMQFGFRFAGAPVPIMSGQLLECNEPTCAAGEPLPQLGPQGFGCDATSCHSTAYGYKPYHKLVVRFADRERASNVFEKQAFDARYTVTVSDTGLQVVEIWQGLGAGSRFGPIETLVRFGLALAGTLVLELVVAGVYALVRRIPATLLIWVAIANLISVPVVWFVFPALGLGYWLTLAAAESFAWLFEAGFLLATNRRVLSPVAALALSLLTNLASFWLGLALG